MRLSIARRLRILFTFSLAGLVAGELCGAPREAVTAARAARELSGAGRVVFRVSGQQRSLMLAAAEVAVPLRNVATTPLPLGAVVALADSQHRFVRLPAGVSAPDWLERAAAAPAANASAVSSPAATRSTPVALAPVFYEQGRHGDPAARHVATLKLLLVGVDRAKADAAGAATGAQSITAPVTDDLWLLGYESAYHMMWAASALQREGLNVEPQFTRSIAKRAAPSDPLYPQQFYFKNTGQDGGTPGEDLNIESLWPATNGAGVTVAVLDDGLEIAHPDLNVVSDPSLHLNVLDGNNDPTPPADSSHGTICGGFIAARANNGIGMTGAAPAARLIGVRLLGEAKDQSSATSEQSASALGWRTNVVQISSNSYGPDDDGKAVTAFDTLELAALRAATTTGRGGRGVVYFFAVGNGRDSGDHAGYDGQSGSRYVLGIGATDNRGKQAAFSESGPNVIVCAAGQTSEGRDKQLLATDNIGPRGANAAASPEGDYTTSTTEGTSYATPQVAGVAALMLQANPNLGWRDVKEIFIRTSRKNDPNDSDWVTNGAGFRFNHKYGAGFVDAAAAVAASRTWTNLGAEISVAQSSSASSAIPDNDSANGTSRALVLAGAQNLRVETIEVSVSVTHANRGQLRFEVTSPAGTRTVLGIPRAPDTGADFTNWVFSSPRHWGELANGTWTVRVTDTVAGTAGTLTGASVTVYGTTTAAAGAPVIAAQPVAASANVGGGATFGVTASGVGPFAYQWKKNGENIAGATGATLTLANVTSADAASYSVVVTNSAGSATSNAATLTVTAAATAPSITTQPSSSSVISGSAASFSVAASGTATLTYQWRKDGTAISGATSSTYSISSTATSDAGSYTVVVTNSAGSATSNAATLTVTATATAPRLYSLAVRTTLEANQVLIVGFTMSGGAKNVLLRAAGPTLGAFGVPETMVDPKLDLYSGSTLITSNDNWNGSSSLAATFQSAGAFAYASATSLDAALVASINGGRTAHVYGPAAGAVLVEGYDVGTGDAQKFTSLSARNRVGTGANILIAGFSLAGEGKRNLLIRAVGPTLGGFGVPSVLTDPKLEIYQGSTKIGENDNWPSTLSTTFSSVGAFGLTAGSKDAAITVSLPAGGYTVQVSGADGGVGEALVEIYELP